MERLLQSRKLSRYKRNDVPVPLQDVIRQLTQRDKDVLLSLYYQRCLTTEQITEIHFRYRQDGGGAENSQAFIMARRRLRKMFDHRLIDRFFVDVGEQNGSSQAHVILDKFGAQVVAGMLECTIDDLNWRYDMNEARLPFLQHVIEVNNLFICMLRTSRQYGHQITDYQTENMTRFEFKHDGRRVVLNPDAYGRYYTPQTGFHFFAEVDRGTESIQQFCSKQRRYASFYASGEYQKYYETFPLVLVVTTVWERAVELRNAIYSIDETDIQWLFTSNDLVQQNILGEIWIGKANEPAGLI